MRLLLRRRPRITLEQRLQVLERNQAEFVKALKDMIEGMAALEQQVNLGNSQAKDAFDALFETVGAHAQLLQRMTSPPELPALERAFGKAN